MTPERDSPRLVTSGSGDRRWPAFGVDEIRSVHEPTLLMVRFQHKSVLTPREITVCKIAAMDSEWSELKQPWERLRWARLYWQRQSGSATTARAAAESLGMNENTYSAYERPPGDGKKHTPLDHTRAAQFGRKFKVNWVWMLSGDETPFGRSAAQARAMELLATAPEDVQEEAVEIMETIIRRRAG